MRGEGRTTDQRGQDSNPEYASGVVFEDAPLSLRGHGHDAVNRPVRDLLVMDLHLDRVKDHHG